MAIVITRPEIASSPLRTRISELMFALQKDAKRNREIEALMVARDYEVDEAYDFSYGVANYDDTNSTCPRDTAYIAIEIIAIKDRYKRLIERCRVRHKRFSDLVEQLPSEDRETLIKAFCTELEVDERDVKRIIRKHLKLIETYYVIEGGDET